MTAPHQAVEWVDGTDGAVKILDQTLLPGQIVYRHLNRPGEVWEAIRALRIRGAPAIGVVAAYGIIVGARTAIDAGRAAFVAKVEAVAEYLKTSRPTAVNLFWALDRMRSAAARTAEPFDGERAIDDLLAEAHAIAEENRRVCRQIGAHGAALVPNRAGILTHCNAGWLATGEYGTALAVLYAAHEAGKWIRVFADETRPLLQGARLTTWELMQRGIDVTLICDSMAAQIMREGRIQLVIVGADRIAANGDTANKIGTYGVAVLARAHGIPFYVAAPSSTFDLSLSTGDFIAIEHRDAREVTHGFGSATAPDGVAVYNPAFDVTPARLITGIITEHGVIQPVTEGAIRARLSAGASRN